MNKQIGLILLIVGVALLVWGVSMAIPAMSPT